MAVGKPRLDPYEKLLHRFYEPLLLLKSLLGNQTLGPHLVAQHEASNTDSARRRFLKNLAFICDSDKGGKSVASIGVEERADSFVLHLALNECDNGTSAAFLQNTLKSLRELPSLPQAQKRERVIELAKKCVAHSSQKVKKEAKSLSGSAKKSKLLLSEEAGGQPDCEGLIEWLNRFDKDCSMPVEPLQMCVLAFRNRRHDRMRHLESTIRNLSNDGSGTTELVKHLGRVRHYIGRLAHHIRSVAELVDDGSRLSDFLASCEVQMVPLPECVPRPPADNHTHFQGIMNRMIPERDKETWAQVTESMDRLQSLFTDADILSLYQSRSFKPRVHSEVQVLEHFHRNRLRFAYNDRFVATSKMSCFCCKLYFRFHPFHMEEPESHGKVYVNWGPIVLPDGRDDPEFLSQRKLMSKITEGVRAETLTRLLDLTSSWAFHHDSITGITPIGNGDDLEDIVPSEPDSTRSSEDDSEDEDVRTPGGGVSL